MFNDFGCDGITRSMNTGVEAHYERKNNDKQCSKYGMLLIDLYKTANLVIVNGRMTNASSSLTLRLEILVQLIFFATAI